MTLSSSSGRAVSTLKGHEVERNRRRGTSLRGDTREMGERTCSARSETSSSPAAEDSSAGSRNLFSKLGLMMTSRSPRVSKEGDTSESSTSVSLRHRRRSAVYENDSGISRGTGPKGRSKGPDVGDVEARGGARGADDEVNSVDQVRIAARSLTWTRGATKAALLRQRRGKFSRKAGGSTLSKLASEAVLGNLPELQAACQEPRDVWEAAEQDKLSDWSLPHYAPYTTDSRHAHGASDGEFFSVELACLGREGHQGQHAHRRGQSLGQVSWPDLYESCAEEPSPVQGQEDYTGEENCSQPATLCTPSAETPATLDHCVQPKPKELTIPETVNVPEPSDPNPSPAISAGTPAWLSEGSQWPKGSSLVFVEPFNSRITKSQTP